MSKAAFVAAVAVLVATAASAHVTLENKQSSISSYYKAVFAVPHGCAGSVTVKLRVQIPEGVTVETVKGKYATEYHGVRRGGSLARTF